MNFLNQVKNSYDSFLMGALFKKSTEWNLNEPSWSGLLIYLYSLDWIIEHFQIIAFELKMLEISEVFLINIQEVILVLKQEAAQTLLSGLIFLHSRSELKLFWNLREFKIHHTCGISHFNKNKNTM